MSLKTLECKSRKAAVFSVIVLLFLSSFLAGAVNAQGTSSNFEGPKGTFFGVEYQGGYLSRLRWGGTYGEPGYYGQSAGSMHEFSTTLKFDSDGADSGKPNIFGEMTSIYLPANTLGNINPWVPASWLNQMQYLDNPRDNVTWEIGGKYYGMQTWLCRWYIAFSGEWEGGINDLPFVGGGYGEAPPQPNYYDGDNSYSDLEVWLKVDLSPTFYYMNAEKTYFALGKVQLSNAIQYEGHTNQYGGLLDTNRVPQRTGVSILPESSSSLLYMYDTPWGDPGSQKQTAYSYQGQALNPGVFKDAVYLKIDFNKFGIYGGTGNLFGVPVLGGWWVVGDTAVVCLDVTVFTIGEWKVQDVQDDPDHYGRFTRTDQSSDFIGWLFSSSTLAWLIPVLIVVALLLFAPWVLWALFAFFRRR